MSTETWVAFVFASTAIALAPGPIILYAVKSTRMGDRAALVKTILGVIAGDLTAMVVSLSGLAVMLYTFPSLDIFIKIIGSVVIMAIGVSAFMQSRSDAKSGQHLSAAPTFGTAYTLAALHPGAIVFYGAFLPQFVDDHTQPTLQLAALCAVFLIIAVMCLLAWVFAADVLEARFSSLQNARYWGVWGSIVMVLFGLGSLWATVRSVF